MSLAFITHKECIDHGAGIQHPECGSRLNAIHDAIIENQLEQQLLFFDAPFATKGQLYSAHSKKYVDFIFDVAPEDEIIWIDPDTFMTPGSLNAALRSAGANVLAVDLIMQNKATQIFCSVRPPGHHAEYSQAMGFCLFNNIAVGTAYAKQKYGIKRIALIDFDVHHGNGTEDIFQNDSDILFCSLFQHPYYPYKGSDTHSDNIINIPISAGTKGDEYKNLFISKCIPEIVNFKPELVFVSAGFDAHIEDDLAQVCLTDADYAFLAAEIKKIANRFCEGKMILTLEGGYNLSALARSVVAVIKELID
ncbi:MAG: histone deacetylase family protein [Gammaproteobacteria bacterium]